MALSKELKLPGVKKKLKGILSSHLEQIRTWIAEGYTKKNIYEYLKKENTIDCSYNHFSTTVNKLLAEVKKVSQGTNSTPISSNYPKKKSFQMVDLDEDDFK